MATKRKSSSSAAASLAAAAAAPPHAAAASPLYRPCHHLQDYKCKHGARGFRALHRFLRTSPNGRASIHPDQIPRCAICTTASGRLFACLVCAAVGCPAHARSHSPAHHLAVDLARAELFCLACSDQVYDPDFDRVVLCSTAFAAKGHLQQPLSSSSISPTRPLRNSNKTPLNVYSRKKYRPWVPTAKDQLILKQGATPLTENSGLPSGLRGLNNMGNTCFMNSVLQALLHTPPLRNYFLSDRHNRALCQKKVARLCLGCDMDDIFSAAFSGDRTPYSPAHFLYRYFCSCFLYFKAYRVNHSWWQHAANLAGYEQQDAHEFFISTVEGLHASSSEASAQSQQTARHAAKVSDAECRCVVHRVFSGLLRSDVTCAACGFTSTTYDPCVDISVDLEPERRQQNGYVYSGSSTLLGCLDRFTRAEKLGSNERFLCESCQVRQEAIKQMSIRKLPLVLCFHVKRFEHSARNYRKVDRYVQFPLSLDMACYLSSSIVRLRHGNRMIFADGTSSSSSGGSDFETGSSSSGSPSSEFELFAVVTHSGKLEGGHYVSYLRLAGQWYKCDDAWITRVSESVVRAAQAYMLFYVQKTLSYKSAAAAVTGEDNPSARVIRQARQVDENTNLSYSTLMTPA